MDFTETLVTQNLISRHFWRSEHWRLITLAFF